MKAKILTAAVLTIFPLAFASIAHAGGKVRWHIYGDQSVLLDDDAYGTRLVTPDEYSDARSSAEDHYGKVNPDRSLLDCQSLFRKRAITSGRFSPGIDFFDHQLGPETL